MGNKHKIFKLCDPMDCSPPVSSVHGTSQARLLEWVAISPEDLPNPGIELLGLRRFTPLNHQGAQ